MINSKSTDIVLIKFIVISFIVSTCDTKIPEKIKKGYAYVSEVEGQKAKFDIDLSTNPKNIIDNEKDVIQYIEDQESFNLAESVPFKTAISSDTELEYWKEAMKKEYDSLIDKNTETLVPNPGEDKVIGGMWILTKKKNEFGEVVRFKA